MLSYTTTVNLYKLLFVEFSCTDWKGKIHLKYSNMLSCIPANPKIFTLVVLQDYISITGEVGLT